MVTLADCGGITAARQLRRAQPTVSQHLARLEAQLGRRLIARAPGGVVLTAEGSRD